MGAATMDPPAVANDTAGEVTPERPEGAADDTTQEAAVDLRIDLGGQLTFGVGGKKPSTSSLRVVGGKVDLDGQLDKGQTATVLLEVEVTSVAFVDKKDPKTGQTTACERQHKARITGIRLVDADEDVA